MSETGCDDWRKLAEAARDEVNPKKLLQLIEQLNRALDEHIKYPRSQSSKLAS